MSAETLIVVSVLLPLVGALGVSLTGKSPNLRESITLLVALGTLGCVLLLCADLGGGADLSGGTPADCTLLEMLPGIPLRFTLEPLGMLFALVASGLWLVTSLYAIGYMRGHHEGHQTRFFACFAVAISAALGIAYAGNLLTLFLFYELLTLSTYPLVTHSGTPEAMRAGRVYLGLLLSTSIGLLLLAILWTWQLTGTLDFRAGGILQGKVQGPSVAVLLGLYAFGIGKAGLMPFHRWLPSAMVAPTPVSALLHAVAVVKAGVFSILKITVYIFGIDFLRASGQSEWLMYVAAFTILAASIVAIRQDNLKLRLAYSTISQLGYIVLGAALASSNAALGAALHIAMHAVAKITLFFVAGAIFVTHHKTRVSELDGIGRRMPLTMTAFCLASLSLIGLPPFGGMWSKWYLALGAADAHERGFILVYMASSLLSIAYLMPIVVRAFFCGEDTAATPAASKTRDWWSEVREAPALCVFPLCVTALASVVLFALAAPLRTFLLPMVGG